MGFEICYRRLHGEKPLFRSSSHFLSAKIVQIGGKMAFLMCHRNLTTKPQNTSNNRFDERHHHVSSGKSCKSPEAYNLR